VNDAAVVVTRRHFNRLTFEKNDTYRQTDRQPHGCFMLTAPVAAVQGDAPAVGNDTDACSMSQLQRYIR